VQCCRRHSEAPGVQGLGFRVQHTWQVGKSVMLQAPLRSARDLGFRVLGSAHLAGGEECNAAGATQKRKGHASEARAALGVDVQQ
jgi:hypothetical protein